MKQLLCAALLAAVPMIALAGFTLEDEIVRLQAAGYDRIEVKTGPTQTKIEAVSGQRKLELVYDGRTGSVLKHEMEAARGDDHIHTGVRYRTRDRDFVDHDG